MSKRTNKRARQVVPDASSWADFDVTSSEALSRASTPSTFTVDDVSSDRRRIHREHILLPRQTPGAQSSRSSSAPDDSPVMPDIGCADEWDPVLLPDVPDGGDEPRPELVGAKERTPRYVSSVSPSTAQIMQGRNSLTSGAPRTSQ